MAEQFRFQQIRGEGGRVERHEGLARARTMAVQSARHEFLARARFARDQNRHAGAGQSADRAEHLLHGYRLAQKLRDAAPRGLSVGRQIGLLRGAAHEVDRLVDVKGFGQVFECAALIGRDRCVQIRMRGHDDDRQSGARDLDFLEQSKPLRPGMRISVMRTSGASPRSAVKTLSAWSKHLAVMPLPFSAFSNTQRMDESSSTSQTCSGFTIHAESIGKEITNIVLPGALSNSIKPP